MLKKYMLHGRLVVETEDLMAWARWFETANRSIGDTTVQGVRVSTIFLGIDHRFFGAGPPLLFETLVIGGPLGGTQLRCSSMAEAEAMHALTVDRVRRAGGPS